MSCAVLLSVAPEFAAKIADGTKTVELRRRFPGVPLGTWVYLYVTLPVGAILGRARVAAIDVDSPARLWQRHREHVGLTRARFDAYYRGSNEGIAVQLAGYEAIVPKALAALRGALDGFVAPQCYRFLDATDQRIILSSPRLARSAQVSRR